MELLGRPVHAAAALFPMLDAAAVHVLADDIAERGLVEPIVTFRGEILDGRARLLACEMAGVEPKFRKWTRRDGSSPAQSVLDWNISRRTLTASQRAVLAVEMEALLTSAVSARPVYASLSDRARASGEAEQSFTGGRVRDHVAATVGVSTGYVAHAKVLRRSAPDLYARMAEGELSMGQARKLATERGVGERATVRLVVTLTDASETDRVLDLLRAHPSVQAAHRA